MKRLILWGAVACGAIGLGVSNASAASTSIYFTGTGTGSVANNLAAEVDFTYDGTSTLTVTLINTSTVQAAQNQDVLEGVYWKYTSSGVGTLSSVNLVTGTSFGGTTMTNTLTTFNSGSSPGLSAEQYFGFVNNLNVTQASVTGLNYVVSASSWTGTLGDHDGMGLPSSGLSNPGNPGGLEGGLIPAVGGSVAGGDGNKAAINNAVQYTISVGTGFNVNNISAAVFGYGTQPDDVVGGSSHTVPPPPVPLPAAIWSGMAMLSGMGAFAKLRKKRVS